jgi:hypothetical protein
MKICGLQDLLTLCRLGLDASSSASSRSSALEQVRFISHFTATFVISGKQPQLAGLVCMLERAFRTHPGLQSTGGA